MAIVDCYGRQTPKGPNYNVTDKFAYQKGPEWKLGTNPRNTLDTKAKNEHYFRKDVDVFPTIYSSISMRQTREEGSVMETPDLGEIQGYICIHVVPTRSKEVQNDPWTRVRAWIKT